VRCQSVTSVTLDITISCDVPQYSLVDIYRLRESWKDKPSVKGSGTHVESDKAVVGPSVKLKE
jgi:hypothetical protein